MFDEMLDIKFPSITGQSETVREAIAKLPKTESIEDKVESELTEIMGIFDIEDTDEARAPFIAMLQNLGVEFDGCMHCGAMPMTTNCNNAGCDE